MIDDKYRFVSSWKYCSLFFGISIFTTAIGSFLSYIKDGDDWIWWIGIACYPISFMLTYLVMDFLGIVAVEESDQQNLK